jgi:hypothetical protein
MCDKLCNVAVVVTTENVGQIPANAEVKLIYGIIGTIRLLAGLCVTISPELEYTLMRLLETG